MSRSDEEGFHPHPGDPWHPQWHGEDDDDVDPFAPKPADAEPEEERPKKRGLFGRKKRSESDAVETDAGDDEDLPEPSGWEAYDDEMVAADLESVVSDEFPSWTDEGGSSVSFESAFTVGGDVGSDPAEEQVGAPEEEIGTVLPGLIAEETGAGDDSPIEPADEILLPELPSVPELPGGDDDPSADSTDLMGEDIATLDDLSSGGGPADDTGLLGSPERDPDVDLTRAAEGAAAALRSRAAEVRRAEALDMVAGELDGVEVDGPPEAEQPVERSIGHQDSLLSAGLDLEDDDEPTDPGFTPESHESDLGGVDDAPADDVAAALEALSGAPAPFDTEGDLPPPLVAAMAEEDLYDDADLTEIVSPEDVDAALSAIASEPIASADADALDALRAIGDGDDIDEWAAFAEGEAVLPDPAIGDDVPEGTLPAPLPDAVDDVSDGGEDVIEEVTGGRGGLFGRRRSRKEAAGGTEVGDPDFDEFDELEPSPEASPTAGESDEAQWRDPQAPLEPSPGSIGWGATEMAPASDEDWDDDALGGDEDADAFFSAEDEPKRGLFGGRKARREAEAAAHAAAAGAAGVADSVTEDLHEPFDEPAAERPGFDDPFADAFSPDPAGGVGGGEEYIPVPVLDGLDEDEAQDPVEDIPLPDDDAAAWEAEHAGEPTPQPLRIEEPMADMPLLDQDDRRVEVTPIGSDSDPVQPPTAADLPAYEDVELDEAPSEWRGEGSSVPASWFAHVDEDEAVVEDMQPVDSDDEAPLLEAGGMFDVDDILDPVATPDPTETAPPPDLSSFEEPAVADLPDVESEEPIEAPRSPRAETGPPPPLGDGAPDFLGAATALIPGGDEESAEPTLWDETVEMDAADVPEPPALPGGGAESWDAPPLVPGHDWDAEEGDGESFAPAPPVAPTGEVYDVVEDDLDSAPVPRPAVVDPDAPVEWSDDIYSGAVTMEHRDLAEAVAFAATEDRDLQALSAAMPGLDSGVVGFEDVEDLGTDEVYVPPARSDLGARVLTGLILVSLLFGSLWVSGGALAAFIGVMLMIGLTEYFTTLRHKGYTPLVIFGYLGAIGALAGTWAWGPIAIPGAILSTTVIVFFFYAFAPRRRDALVNGGLTVMGMAWVTATIAFAMPIIASEDYRVLVFALVAATVAMDVGAYAFGRAWGSAPLAPVLSPNKSIEGLAGGVVLAIGASIAIGFLMDPFDIRSGAALGLVVAITAPLGDLAESMFKRSLGVKDMGAILPGHGGILDRVDAFLFVIPSVWVLYAFLGYLT